MKRISVLPLLATATAALFAGCEWTSSSGESSWSGSYDDMNFAGTYRISSLAQTGEGGGSTAATWTTTTEGGGTFAAGKTTASGKTGHNNVVPGSVKISAGGYVWTDDGSGNLNFNGGSAGTEERSATKRIDNELVGTTTAGIPSYSHVTEHPNLVEGSVSVTIEGFGVFNDTGSGTLLYIDSSGAQKGRGDVNYKNGVVHIRLTGSTTPTNFGGKKITVAYVYQTTTGQSSAGVSGSGTVAYASGAWTLVLSTGMSSASPISVTYSYYASTTGIDASTFDATKVTAISVSQTGQHLTMSFNNGVTMSGQFTSVRQTNANSSTDTVNTYNAQFQVSSGSGGKCVGTLSYDTANAVRVLNGTWTWGSKTFDVNAVGPSF